MFCLLSINPHAQAEMARPADSFVDSIGVNTHFGIASVYSASTTTDRLHESGIRYIRNNRSPVPSLHTGSNPIKTLIVIDSASITPETAVSWLANDDVLGVEGFNEPENWPRTWHDVADQFESHEYNGTRYYQRDLYDAAKAASAPAKFKPILSPAMGWWRHEGSLPTVPFDKLALHSYKKGYHPGSGYIYEAVPYVSEGVATGQGPGGTWVTEEGYTTATNSTSGLAITENAAGKYIPRLLALNFNRWIEKSFIYEFADEGTSLTNGEQRMGLINYNGTRKPAFWAIKNLISLLNDPSASFQPGALDITLTGDTTNVNRTLLQKSDGDYYLLLWKEVYSCDKSSTPPQDIAVTPASLTLGLGSQATSVTVYSNLAQETCTTTSYSNINSLALDVPDEVVVVKVSGIATAGSGTPKPASGPDLVITKAWSVPTNPAVGEPATLYLDVLNRGTSSAGASTARMHIDGNPNYSSITFSTPALTSGENATIASSSAWTPGSSAGGYHNFSIKCDATSVVVETDENNNKHLLTIPVLTGRWTDPCESLDAWTASNPGNWIVQTVGARTFFMNTNQYASGKLTRVLDNSVTSGWKLDFEHNWRWGAAAYNLYVMGDVLDSSGNGYRVQVRQGISNNSGNIGKLIQIYKMTAYVAASTPLAEGPGYNRYGDSTYQNFMPVSFIYDQATQSLSVYIDYDGDGELEQAIPPVRDTNSPTMTFEQVVLSARDGQGSSTKPMFDNVTLSTGTLNLAPAPYFADDLDDLSEWPDVTNWTIATIGNQTYVKNTAQYASGTMTHTFPTVLKDGWALGFDYDVNWGGHGSAPQWGHSNISVRADMLDANNNGYRVTVKQGDSGVAANNGKMIVVSRIDNGTPTTIGTTGIGYNTPGWQSMGRSQPDFKHVAFVYNRAMQTLSVLIDLDRNGTMEQVVAPINDTTYTDFTKLVLGASDGQGGSPGVGPLFDNIEVGLIR